MSVPHKTCRHARLKSIQCPAQSPVTPHQSNLIVLSLSQNHSMWIRQHTSSYTITGHTHTHQWLRQIHPPTHPPVVAPTLVVAQNSHIHTHQWLRQHNLPPWPTSPLPTSPLAPSPPSLQSRIALSLTQQWLRHCSQTHTAVVATQGLRR